VADGVGRTVLRVPRRTGTAGDELIAWGLARVIADAIGEEVVLADAGTQLRIELPLGAAELEERLAEPESMDAARLRWLADSSKQGRHAPSGFPGVDYAALKQANAAVRAARVAARAAGPGAEVGEPAVTVQVAADQYPLYRVLTNPGTQWGGYNKLVETTSAFTQPAGLRLLAKRFNATAPLSDDEVDDALKRLGVAPGERWRNPPGYLFLGMNKGPTQPLAIASVVRVGDPGRPNPLMADRGDLCALELLLAYIGYFSVARVLDWEQGRFVLVPVPARISVPRGLATVQRVLFRASSSSDLLASAVSLSYARAVLGYLAELRAANPEEAAREGTVLHGVAVAHYWKPSGNTYAPLRGGFAPLPRWLATLHAEDWEVAAGTLDHHLAQLRGMRGATRDERLAGSQREAFRLYRTSLDGEAKDWLLAVAAWFPALREAARAGAQFRPRLWAYADARRIAVALDPHLANIVDQPAFRAVSDAIRSATVLPHLARQRHRERGGPRPAFEPEYDLVSGLAAAADRSPEEFIGELCRFAARYNDATMRRNAEVRGEEGRGQRRRFLRDEDLRQVIAWLEQDRRGTIAAALLAFGTCLAGRAAEAAGAPHPPPDGGAHLEPLADTDDLETEEE